ncbi:hypothetical protein CMV_010733 [Castanea mollissima]|uniref:Uncharacterized protein n=1 Tax=Castanea mollissima TaxID=60419 RepID=A0A8J4R680_9ROSI|nr:hypothetical protein CMV_010733 [Castanea mollissima]
MSAGINLRSHFTLVILKSLVDHYLCCWDHIFMCFQQVQRSQWQNQFQIVPENNGIFVYLPIFWHCGFTLGMKIMSCRVLDFLSQCHCLQPMSGLNIKNTNLKLIIVELHITGTYQDVEEDVIVSGTLEG